MMSAPRPQAARQFNYDRMLIDGKWVEASGGRTYEIPNPATEEVLGRAPDASREDMRRAITAARRAFDDGAWRKTTPHDRSRVLHAIADAFEARKEEMREILIAEAGACWVSHDTQVEWPIRHLRNYADLALSFPFEQMLPAPPMQSPMGSWLNTSMVHNAPVGVCGLIPTWNFPVFVLVQKIGPALATGNTMVVKPSPYGPLINLWVAEVIEKAADLPPGVINWVTGQSAEISRGAGRQSRHRQGQLHRIDRRRPSDPRRRGRPAAPRPPRARRQVGAHPARRRRPRHGRAGAGGAELLPFGPGLRHGDPRPGAEGGRRARDRQDGQFRRQPRHRQDRKSRGPERPDGPGRARGAPPGDRSLHRQRCPRRGASGHRRQAAGRARHRLLPRADDLRRRRQQPEDRPGGDLRTGRDGEHVQRPRRGDPHRQRLRLRSGRDDHRHRPGEGGRGRASATDGQRLDQRRRQPRQRARSAASSCRGSVARAACGACTSSPRCSTSSGAADPAQDSGSGAAPRFTLPSSGRMLCPAAFFSRSMRSISSAPLLVTTSWSWERKFATRLTRSMTTSMIFHWPSVLAQPVVDQDVVARRRAGSWS